MIRLIIWLVSLCFFLSFLGTGSGYYNWQIYKNDDGTLDSYWGGCGGTGHVLCKTFVLESVEGAKDAMIRYEIGTDPYHYQTKISYSKPREGIQWNNMVILVNDVVVAKESPINLGTKGWHRVQFDAKLLKKGENTVKFTWAKGTKEGGGRFYFGIDKATSKGQSSSSKDSGKTFSTECLRPGSGPNPKWQGEYMVRLFVAFAEQGAETPSASNTAVKAANP